MINYLKRIGIAVSVLVNVILGGYSNQTLSARNWQLKRRGRPHLAWLIDRVFFLDSNHCLESWVYWITRKDVMYFIEKEELTWLLVNTPPKASTRRFLVKLSTRSRETRPTEIKSLTK